MGKISGSITDQVLASTREREFFIDNLLVRIHSIIGMILEDWPCAMAVVIPVCR